MGVKSRPDIGAMKIWTVKEKNRRNYGNEAIELDKVNIKEKTRSLQQSKIADENKLYSFTLKNVWTKLCLI